MKFLRCEVKGAEKLSYVQEAEGTFLNDNEKPGKDKK